jgi:hypothetical protein
LNLPPAQASHLGWPSLAWNLPLAQSKQAEAPSLLYFPVAQLWHAGVPAVSA